MPKIKKINIEGVDYNIAHEGELKNSGFEQVSALPTTNLFVGRQVYYNGKIYYYNGTTWVDLPPIPSKTVLGNISSSTQAPQPISAITKINGTGVLLGSENIIAGGVWYLQSYFLPKIEIHDGRKYLVLYDFNTGGWVNSFAFCNCTTTTVTLNDLDSWWLPDNSQYEFDTDISNNLLEYSEFFANKLAPAMGKYQGTPLKFKLRPTTVKDYKGALDTLMSNFSAVFDIIKVDDIKKLYNGSLSSAGDYSFDIEVSRYTENEKYVYGMIKITVYKSYE